MTDIVLNDFAGHPFTFDLAATLVERGYCLEYHYCVDNLAPHASFDAARAPVVPIGAGGHFNKYNVGRRAVAELIYGLRSAWRVFRLSPRHVVVTNMPILSALIVWIAARARQAHTVLWLQDLQSGLASRSLGSRSRLVPVVQFLEAKTIRGADRIIAISERLGQASIELGADPSRVTILPNWPSLEDLPVVPRDNSWAAEQDLAPDRLRFLYSGTLARKHRPELLWHLAGSRPDIDVIVVSEGEGAAWLRARLLEQKLPNLHVYPYQPFERLAEVLGCADVLIAILQPEASAFSVPSKVLSYLCASRPILAAMPSDNPAAQVIDLQARAGVVVRPDDLDGFVRAAESLASDQGSRTLMGRRGREYAERSFSRDQVADRFALAAQLHDPAQRAR